MRKIDEWIRFLQGTPYLHFLLNALIYRHYVNSVYTKGTYKGTYNGFIVMLESLSFGEPYQHKTGTKAGRWNAKASIPSRHHEKFNRKQWAISLGSGSEADAISRLPKKVAEAQRKYRDAIAEHDPLLEAAERLYDALFATYEAGGKRLPVAEWWPSPITKEELLKLRHYTNAASTEKTEFNRIVQSLRDEVYKLLHAEYDSSTHETVPDGLSYLRDVMLKMDAPDAEKQRVAETIEMIQSNMDIGIEAGAPRYHHWQPQGSLEKMKEPLREQGKTDAEIKEHINLMYKSGIPQFTYEALNKRDIINNALKAFEDQHSQRTGTKLVVGKTYSDAMSEWLSKAQSGVGKQKRQKTIGEYTNSQNLFLELYGDIDLSEIDSSTALGIIEHLEQDGAANGTIRKHLSGMRAPLERAVEKQWISEDPTLGVEITKRGKAAVKTDNWNTADFNRLFAQDIKQQELMLFQLLSATGFRLEEGAAIEWADIKLSSEGVNYFDLHALNKVLKTENAMRNVPIHHQLMSLLNAYGGAVGRDGRLFKYRKDKKDGKCVRNATKALTPYLKVARYENGTKVKHLKTHGLRGTFTSACYKVGMPDSMRRFLIGQKQQGEDTAYLEADLDRENEMLQKITFTQEGGIS